MRRPVLVLPAMLLVVGCADLSPLELLVQARSGVDRIGGTVMDKAAGQIDAYCGVPLPDRLKLREGLNSRTQKGDIAVTCEGDPAPPAPAPVATPAVAPRPVQPRPVQPRPVQPAR